MDAYLSRHADTLLARVRELILAGMHREANVLAAHLRGDHPSFAISVNGKPFTGEPAGGLSHRILMAPRAAAETPLLLLAHTFLDQTARRHPNGQPFGWTMSIRQDVATADLVVVQQREFAATFSGALSDDALPLKLIEAAGEFRDALEAGRFSLGGDTVRGVVRRHLHGHKTNRPAPAHTRKQRDGR
jgi:hypothetical protein